MQQTKSTFFILILIASTMLTQCVGEEGEPKELLLNGNMESGFSNPNDWFSHSGQNNYFVNWNDQEFTSPGHSLEISTPVAHNTQFAVWGQIISNDLPTGKKLTLRVKIKGDLTGEGVSIAIRADDENPPQGTGEQLASTQYDIIINGTFDWTEYSIELNALDENMETVTAYLVFLPNTTGEVYFDDAQLLY